MEQDGSQEHLLKLFEGVWISSPSGKRCYAKIINGKLLIPYSQSEENKLAGHYYNCCVTGNKLICRFERFEPYTVGILLLKLGPNKTLKGGWWLSEKLPKIIQHDISQISEDLPGMVHCVWILMPKARIPRWVKEYFLKDATE